MENMSNKNFDIEKLKEKYKSPGKIDDLNYDNVFYATYLWSSFCKDMDLFVSGIKEFDYDAFAEAVRLTYAAVAALVFCTKDEDAFRMIYPDVDISFADCGLLVSRMGAFGHIDKYLTKKNNIKIKAACLVTRLLADTILLSPDEDSFVGKLSTEYDCEYVYDIEKGDLSDFIELMETLDEEELKIKY